jgi:SAM-dependent methyltransferase
MKTFKFLECRCCTNKDIKLWLDFDHTPIANLITPRPIYDRHPLSIYYCELCGHLQLYEVPDPGNVFIDYRYMSGVSLTFREHFIELAKSIVDKYGKGNILEIGSNDAFLLNEFKNNGCDVIGIEPSIHLSKFYSDYGIPLINDFFTSSIIDKHELNNKFDIICANNVMAHVPDNLELINNIAKTLKDDGILVAECGDQLGILNGEYSDNVYHEHIDYYSPYSFSKLAERANLYVQEVLPINTHGKSFRVICKKSNSNFKFNISLCDFSKASIYVSNLFRQRRERILNALNGEKFIAYGAAAKSVTSLYTLDLTDYLMGVVDDNPLKQGMYFPGTSIQIESSINLDRDATILVTAWNLFDEIKAKLLLNNHSGNIICM